VGVAIALVGVAMLAVPAATRRWMRLLFGVHLPEGRLERVSAWLLVVLGLAIAFIARVAR
jgi:hypothetical protein